MRVLLDGRVTGPDGIGRYTRSVIQALADSGPTGVEVVIARTGGVGRYSRSSGDELLDLIREHDADLLHVLDHRVPLTAAPEVPTIVTVHDVMRLTDPTLCYSDAEFAARFGTSAAAGLRDAVADLAKMVSLPEGITAISAHHEFLGRMLALAVRHASYVITPTRAVARELETMLPSGDRVRVTPWGADHLPAPAPARVDLPERFVLYVGQARPHKGLLALFEAMSRSTAAATLILVGRDMTRGGEAATAARAALGVDRVVALAEVTDEFLALLYARASVLVHLADHEGFGFPPLEALCHGCPVIVSDTPALRETCGEVAVFVDPRDPDEVARRVNETIDADRTCAGADRAAWASRFSWARHVEDVVLCYRAAAR